MTIMAVMIGLFAVDLPFGGANETQFASGFDINNVKHVDEAIADTNLQIAMRELDGFGLQSTTGAASYAPSGELWNWLAYWNDCQRLAVNAQDYGLKDACENDAISYSAYILANHCLAAVTCAERDQVTYSVLRSDALRDIPIISQLWNLYKRIVRRFLIICKTGWTGNVSDEYGFSDSYRVNGLARFLACIIGGFLGFGPIIYLIVLAIRALRPGPDPYKNVANATSLLDDPYGAQLYGAIEIAAVGFSQGYPAEWAATNGLVWNEIVVLN